MSLTKFNRNYIGIFYKTLASIPRLISKPKNNIFGKSAVGDFTRQQTNKEVVGNCNLLCVVKPGDDFVFDFLSRFRGTHVVDFIFGLRYAYHRYVYEIDDLTFANSH